MARSTKTTTTTTTTRKATSAGRTSTRRTTTKAKAKPAVKAASTTKATTAKAKAPASPVVTLVSDKAKDTAPAATGETFRRPDLIQAVADRTSLKRSDAKDVLDLVLDELGKALDGRDELVLPPLGKLSIKGRREAANGAMLTVKLKRKSRAQDQSGQTGLAKGEADS